MPIYSQAGPDFPIETWRYIFSLATAIPGKNEFSLHHDSFGMMPHGPERQSIFLTREELSGILKTRYTIVRICRRWYDLGICPLWSHLRMQVVNWETQALTIKEVIKSKPYLIEDILRFTLDDAQNDRALEASEAVIRGPEGHVQPSTRLLS